MMADSDELAAMKEKVQKLLALARDRQGTPEGETFENKAFELMAKYGVSAAALEADGNGSDRQRARISRHRQNFSTRIRICSFHCSMGSVLPCTAIP